MGGVTGFDMYHIRELRREAERRAGEPETTGKTRGSKRSEVRG